jgi:hypothetical protein
MEFLDVVDENDKVIGKAPKGKSTLESRVLHNWFSLSSISFFPASNMPKSYLVKYLKLYSKIHNHLSSSS